MIFYISGLSGPKHDDGLPYTTLSYADGPGFEKWYEVAGDAVRAVVAHLAQHVKEKGVDVVVERLQRRRQLLHESTQLAAGEPRLCYVDTRLFSPL